MKDRIFFPLAVLLVAGLVALAILPGRNRLPTGAVAGDGGNYERIEVSGKYLNKLVPTETASYRILRPNESDYALEITADSSTIPENAEFGPHFRIDADIEMRFAKHPIRITLTVRRGDNNTQQVAINYSAGKTQESGWRIFDIGPQASEVTFVYNVPESSGGNSVDYLGIRPVSESGTGRVIVEKIVMEQVN